MSVSKLCILGCGGFIGSYILDRVLADPVYTVCGVDVSSYKIQRHLDNPSFVYVNMDISDVTRLRPLVEGCDVVVSLAALCNPSLYNTAPLRVIENNFNQPLAIASMCAEMKKRLVHFSTCEVYGRTVESYVERNINGIPAAFNEDTTPYVLGPIHAQRWTYSCAKQLSERMIYAYGYEKGLEYTIVRPFNFIGPGMDYIPGIDGEGIPRVIACFMDSLMAGKPLKLVDGGHNMRTFTYIDDAVDAIMAIINCPEKTKGMIFNIGNPQNETTIAGLAAKMRDIYESIRPQAPLCDIVPVTAEEFYGKGYEDSDRRIPDISKARELLGWTPHVSLDDALVKTITGFANNYFL
ncbi:MAG TPA: bifunctional UDP-4-keto-pentose/UDP-xylose synthase [Fibrobacteres bacterium]|nr:bifunctional UDP-4-keto-pentose/UDP-xylose synthase [Fibrobacterota bacterium]